MTQHSTKNNELEDITGDDFLDNIGEEDFVFVVDKNGDLKTVLMPEECQDGDFPEGITDVLKFFKIGAVYPRTFH